MVPDTSGWHSPQGTATSDFECAELCQADKTEALPYQWSVLTKADTKCYCRLDIDQGK